MSLDTPPQDIGNRVVIIGAGIAGLAAAARLAHAGRDVIVLERHDAPGGKMRCLPSEAGPVDTGPTVLTYRHVFDALFSELGEKIEDHVKLIPQHLIARHFWPDGSQLDLFDDEALNARAIEDFAGPKAAQQFQSFSNRARQLFAGFDQPMMQDAHPSLPGLVKHVAARPALIRQMAPLSTLDALLKRSFDDPRLVQLFGRYATYVGGSPYQSPALLSLIWQVESEGVWVVRGGMHRLAQAIANLASARGAEFRYNTHVDQIETADGRVTGLRLSDGTPIAAQTVLFNGDPRALATGAMGPDCTGIAPQTSRIQRSLSAEVWAFAARVTGPELAHHNVFFRDDPKSEFDSLEKGKMADDPTLYICAMDRGLPESPPEVERFEIIANAPPLTMTPGPTGKEELSQCQNRTFQTLTRFGLQFDPIPGGLSLTTPTRFEALFPATAGSLYGQSPHGMMAAFQRPTARTQIKGLYLAGGGTHPGAGVPMATLSAQHAAEAILSNQTSTLMSRPTATRGGISTGSATTAGAPSASSGS
jgi:1-hydroxycarotenoid 3,4-desaturase